MASPVPTYMGSGWIVVLVPVVRRELFPGSVRNHLGRLVTVTTAVEPDLMTCGY